MKKEPTVIDVLKRMRTLLRKGWTQKTSARGRTGRPVKSESPRAVSFCLIGAESRAGHDLGFEQFNLTSFLLRSCTPDGDRVGFNDTDGRKKSEVLAVVDCAIKKAQAA